MQNADLNLLHLFSVLYQERSVGRAAERMFLTSSAISHALRRLRRMLNDELFTRGPGGMTPTPRAHEIARRLDSVLPQLAAVLEPPAFDPALTSRVFTLCCWPYLASTFVPVLAAAVHAAAPGARLDTTALHAGVVDDLEAGRLDIVLGNFRRTPPQLVTEELFRENSVWVLRRGHPLARRALTLEVLAKMPHVEVVLNDVNGGDSYIVRRGLERLVMHNSLGAIDLAFGAAGLHRDIGWRAPDSLSALAIVARTDGVALVPESAARLLERSLELEIFTTSPMSAPLVVQMLSHQELGTRAAVAWLRQKARGSTPGLA